MIFTESLSFPLTYFLAFDYFAPFGTNEPKTPAKISLYAILISSSPSGSSFSGILGARGKRQIL